MKNLRVSLKLVISFLLIAALTAAVGIMGITGMLQMDASGIEMYEDAAQPTPYLAHVLETLQNIRVYVREMVIASMNDDLAGVETSFSTVGGLVDDLAESLDAFEATMDPGTEERKLFDEARSLYENELTQVVMNIYYASQVQDVQTILDNMEPCRYYSDMILDNLYACLDIKVATAETLSADATRLARTLLITIITLLAIAIGAAIFLAAYISGLISKPLALISKIMRNAGTTGNIKLTSQDKESVRKYALVKDEIGQTVAGCNAFIDYVTGVGAELEVIASGDLSATVKLLSDEDTIGQSLKYMLENLNEMFGSISESTTQVAAGSRQIAEGSQMLAQGATEQAATVEQLSNSISEISDMTKKNAEQAVHAAELANSIKDNAETGNRQMSNMIEAVEEISQASQSIGTVIKAIDDIAFQTNILALNAAVEAARAGQHGKGFAVVAEEVRNLAAKSAEAAKDTGAMIENSIQKANIGVKIAGETAESLNEIVNGINESSEIVNEIAKSSEQQSSSIDRINTGIEQVTHVIQQNSATAQQSAASSEQMSSQSGTLEELISQFKLANRQGGSSVKRLTS